MKPICIESEPIPLDNLDQETFEQLLISKTASVANGTPAFLLIHAFDAVQVGAVINNNLKLKLTFRLEDLMDLRMFGSMGELHVWRKPDGLAAKLLIDADGESSAGGWWVKEEHHGMWGDTVLFENGWWKLTEKRISPIYVPFIAKPDMFYKVRNYYSFDDNGQARCNDARLCGFFYTTDQPVQWP